MSETNSDFQVGPWVVTTVLVSLVILVATAIGYFASGYTVFIGKFEPNIMSALFTMIGAILGPATSIVAALLFYSSLRAQTKSLAIQMKEAADSRSQFTQELLDSRFYSLLGEIKSLNESLQLAPAFRFDGSIGKALSGLDVISEIRVWQIYQRSLKGKGAQKTAEQASMAAMLDPEFREESVNYEGYFCVFRVRDVAEAKYIERTENRIWLLFKAMLDLLNRIEDSEMHKRILMSHLNKDYLEVILALCNRKNWHPESKFVFELIEML